MTHGKLVTDLSHNSHNAVKTMKMSLNIYSYEKYAEGKQQNVNQT